MPYMLVMKNILITGGTGLVGRRLCQKLKEKGYTPALLSRSAPLNSEIKTYKWDPNKNEIDKRALEWADCVIHLAGAGIGDRWWTKRRKQLIVESRIKTGDLIFEQIEKTKHPLKAFISASAIGYYGAVSSNKVFGEQDLAATDFVGEVCRLWEHSADRFERLGTRTVKLRIGLVLSPRGGALEKLATPIKMGIGCALGSGNQYMPWIHIDDLCDMFIKATEDSGMRGAYNAVAPEHINNKNFTTILAKILHKKIWLPPIPSFILKLAFGERACLFLTGSRVSSEKISREGFQFKFSSLKTALLNLLENKT